MKLLQILLESVLMRRRAESEMDMELRFHLESRIADLESRGLSPAEAKRRAHLEFGNVEVHKESIREARGFRLFDALRTDARFTWRTLGRSPIFAICAVISLALGIGVNLATFASLYSTVLRPFPYPDLDRIMTVAMRIDSFADIDPVAPGTYFDWQRLNHSFAALAAYREWDVNLTGIDHPDHVHGAVVSANFFKVFGIVPELGRTFTEEECQSERGAVIVISHRFWRGRMGGRTNPIGASLDFGRQRYTVIGVMPDRLNFPLAAEMWAPLSLTPSERASHSGNSLMTIGKLLPDVSAAQATTDMNAITQQLERLYPKTNSGKRVLMTPLRTAALLRTGMDRFTLVLMCAAGFVLLLACTNVGSLQLARTVERRKEMAIRQALGAGTPRILRLLGIENLTLGIAGGLLGVILAALDIRVMFSNMPAMALQVVAGINQVRVNVPVVIFAVFLTLMVVFLCCLPSALRLYLDSSHNLTGSLKDGGRYSGDSSLRRGKARGALVVTEVALAFVLLVGAGLMVNTFQKMLIFNVGYDPSNILAANVDLSALQYQTRWSIAEFYDAVLEPMSQTKGVQAIAAIGGPGWAEPITVAGRPPARSDEPLPQLWSSTPSYLQVMRIPLLKGRWIASTDDVRAPKIVVLSTSIARHYWPDANPLGQRVQIGGPDAPWLTVVGVTGDVLDWFSGAATPAAYVSYRQVPQRSMQFVLRGVHDSHELTDNLRLAVATVDKEQPIYNVRTMEEQRSEEMWGIRSAAIMMGTYAAIALLLAITGIYSVSSFSIAQRTHEIGVRMSLGATRRSILKTMLWQSCVMTVIGLAIGGPVAILLTLGMSHVLFDVVAVKMTAFIAIFLVLGGTGMLAGLIPALRGARTDPMTILRHE